MESFVLDGLPLCFTRFWKTRAFPFFLSRIVDGRGGLIGLSRSRCNVHGSFDRSSLSFQSGLHPRDTGADLVYPDVFCGNILSYKIADIHRISIEMAADVAAAIGRRALSRLLRDASLSVGPLTRLVRSHAIL